MKGRRVAMTARTSPPFIPDTSGPHVGGLIPVIALADAGDRLIRDNALVDPAPSIARQLSDDLGRAYGVEPATERFAVVDDDPTKFAAASPSADLVLDVWTSTWRFEPYSYKSSKYRVTYTAYLRLIDAKVLRPLDGKKGQVIAHGTCSRSPEETASAPSHDELLANGAQRLKSELAVAARFCVDEFRAKILAAPAR